jgi:hypothetical protein
MKKKIYAIGIGLMAFMLDATVADAQIFNNLGGNFVGMHRGSPSVVDYNNDGIADLYYGGATWLLEDPELEDYTKSWSAQSFLYTGKGNNEYTKLRSNLYDDPEGRFLANGLPPMYYQKVIWFDYNNDGNIDFLCQGKSGCSLDIKVSPDGTYTWLYTNGGAAANWQFSPVANTGITQSLDLQKAADFGNINASYSAVGDYDNDGYQDFITLGERNYYKEGDETAWERYIKLYHNNGDGTFTEKKVFNPIPYASNPRPKELFEIDSETFEETPLMVAKPMSSGSIRFADLNNDGYLDVVASGYCNDGGATFYIYKNNGDGTFQEVDLSGQDFTGVYESDLAIADINNDGWLDIISVGTPNEGNKRADIYLNEGATAPFTFTASTVDGGNGLYGVSAGHVEAADLNGDGMTDLILYGWTNVDDKGWGGYVFIQNEDQTFTLSETVFNRLNAGGYCIGDVMGKGSVDIFNEQADYNDDWLLHEDVIENTNMDNTAPQAPADVTATTDADGITLITWSEGSDDQTDAEGLRYNIYAKNTQTGAISMIIPADEVSGKLRVMRDWQLLAHGGENIGYPIKLADGDYEIGVSTVDPGYQASAFATTTLNVTTDIVKSLRETKTVIETVPGGVFVHGQQGLQVSVFTADGSAVVRGTSGKLIPVSGKGLYIVKAGTETAKVIIK